MAIYFVDAGNDFSDQSFLLEAEDFVSATMKAVDFLGELDRRLAAQSHEDDLPPTVIRTMNETGALWMNEEGMKECLSKIEIHQADE